MNRQKTEWDFSKVADDRMAMGPDLEDLLYLAGLVKEWVPVFNNEGDNMTGFIGEANLPWLRYSENKGLPTSYSFKVELRKPGEGYMIVAWDSGKTRDLYQFLHDETPMSVADGPKILAKKSSPEVERLYRKVEEEYLSRVNEVYGSSVKRAAEVISIARGAEKK